MTQEFIRERLFRPFDSTKAGEGIGIGAYQVREFARNLEPISNQIVAALRLGLRKNRRRRGYDLV